MSQNTGLGARRTARTIGKDGPMSTAAFGLVLAVLSALNDARMVQVGEAVQSNTVRAWVAIGAAGAIVGLSSFLWNVAP